MRATPCLEPLHRRSGELSGSAGDVVNVARAQNNEGEIVSDQGKLEEAEALFLEAQRVWRAARYPWASRSPPRTSGESQPVCVASTKRWAEPASPARSRGREPGDPRAPRRSLDAARAAALKNGAPGLEKRLSMIYEFGVRAGRIS